MTAVLPPPELATGYSPRDIYEAELNRAALAEARYLKAVSLALQSLQTSRVVVHGEVVG